jgi:hypothetical protein
MSVLHRWMRLVAMMWFGLALTPIRHAFASQRTSAFSYGATYSGYHDVTERADRSNVGFTSDTVFNGGPLFNEHYARGNQLPRDAIGTVESDYPGHSEDSTFSYDAQIGPPDRGRRFSPIVSLYVSFAASARPLCSAFSPDSTAAARLASRPAGTDPCD